jgi:Ca-activated chloride channel family protein
MLLLVPAASSRAAEVPPASAPDVRSWNDTERGLRAFQQGKYEEAKRRFGSAQARAPQVPELGFNQGVIQLKDGDMDGAGEAFQGAAEQARLRGDPKLEAQAWFNRGIARGQKGDLVPAVDSYVRAIEAARAAGDADLERDARKNLELLVQRGGGKGKRDQKDQNGESQDGQGDSKDGKGSKDQKDPKKGDSDKDKNDKDQKGKGESDKNKDKEQKQGQDREVRQGKFSSPKLKLEDAERVMGELAGKEKDLQARLKRQKGTPAGTEKDW